VLSSARSYAAADGALQPLYCQVSECSALPPDNAPRTGLKDMGLMCGRVCDASACGPDELRLECSLPHDTRCVRARPAARPGQRRAGAAPAHANLLARQRV